MLRGGALFLLVVAWIAALASFGIHLNDEAELAAAAHNLYEGRLTVDEVPGGYYRGENGAYSESRVRVVGGHGYIAETRAMPVLSAPVFWALTLATLVAPLQVLLVLLACGALGGGIALARADAWKGMPRARRRVEVGALATGVALFAGANAWLARPIPDLWIAPVAMQVTTILVVALAAVALRDWARAVSTRPWHGEIAVVALLLGTSAPFWAFGQKYHGLQLALACIALWARWTPGHAVRHHALAYVAAGVAIWSHPKAGGMILLALGIVEAVVALRRWRAWRGEAKRAAVLALALVVGLAPYFLENQLLYGSPWLPGYATVGSDAALVGDVEAGNVPDGAQTEFHKPRFGEILYAIVFGQTILADPPHGASIVVETWIAPGLLTSEVNVQFGMVMLSPLIVLAPFGLYARRRELGGGDAFLLAYVGLMVLLYSGRAAAPGGGSYDSRYLAPLLPALAFYAAAALSEAVRDGGRTVVLGLAAAVPLLLGGALALLAALPHDFTLQFHVLRRIGIAAAGALALWWTARGALGARIPAGARPYLDAPTLALAFATTALFFAQFLVHHPPRQIVTDEGTVAHFLPVVQLASRALDLALGT